MTDARPLGNRSPRMRKTFLIVPFLILLGAGCAPSRMTDPVIGPKAEAKNFPGSMPESDRVGREVRIKTAKGDIVFELYGTEAPIAASNFVWLARHGFYDGLTFHRVEPGFVIQGGDPKGNGTGDPGYRFKDEPVTRDYDQGIVAMANAGPDTNGSQFFIMLADNKGLPKNYTIFGKVISGMEAVQKIVPGDVMTAVTVEKKP